MPTTLSILRKNKMKQTLNKLLFVLGLVVLANIIPSIASADTFIYNNTQVSFNVDASTPSSTVASASVDCLSGSLCSSIDAQITASYSNLSQTVLSVWGGGIYEYGSAMFDLSGYSLGGSYMNFSGSVQSAGISYDLPFYLGANPSLVSVTASPSTIVYGVPTDINVSWTSTGADNCAEDGERGGTGTSGSFVDYGVWDVATYSVFCYDISGTVSGYGEASVDAYDPPPTPTVTVYANGQNPLTVKSGDNVNITWRATNATSCKRTDEGTDVLVNDLKGFSETMSADKTFTIECRND